jgi:Reverse transcriptase (RNA-dependent DNA polymerase)
LTDTLSKHDVPQEKRIRIVPTRFGFSVLQEKVKLLTDRKSFSESQEKVDAVSWKLAYDNEIKSIEDVAEMKTILLEEVPSTAQVLPVKEIFVKKMDNIKNVEKYKVRIVARGDREKELPDSVYAPVASMEVIGIIFGFATRSQWFCRQAEISTAFLYGRSSKQIFLQSPIGHRLFVTHCWTGLAGVYGLTVAPLVWNHTLHLVLTDFGF